MTRRRLLALLAAPGLTAAAWFTNARARNAYYEGPVTDHFDGLRFFNPDLPWTKTPFEAFRALALAEKAKWPAKWPSPFRDRPPRRVDGAALRVVAVGHATHLIQAAGLNILTDPVWSERCSPVSFTGPKRVCPPGIAFDDLPPIDVVLLSHNHYDHMDVATLSALAARDQPRVIVPLGNDAILKAHDPAIRAEAYDWGDRVPLSADVATTLRPAYHWSARGVADRRKALWCAFALDAGASGRVYIAGDTGFGPAANFPAAREAHGPFRLAILPIGAYEPRWFMKDQHMNPEDAVEAMQLLGAEQAIGCHWGVFQLTAEAIDAPAKELAAALKARGMSPERFRALRPGEVWESSAP
jgi:L-ascorbate metabolism protein UlaG (beta-lactamase superfamily)